VLDREAGGVGDDGEMAYVLRGLIGGQPAVGAAAARLGGVPVALGQGLLLLPGPVVGEDEPVGVVEAVWWGLVERVAVDARAASRLGPIAYVEAEFFGGVGEQASVVWDHGEAVLGPMVQEFSPGAPTAMVGPINAALRWLGVTALVGRDEFDTLELGRHRHVEDWTAG
jgi:hypothetical protein